jgi:hypothetical protein
MPYYVFKIMPSVGNLVKNLELQESFENYKDAKQLVKQKRMEQDAADESSYKVMFAETQLKLKKN